MRVPADCSARHIKRCNKQSEFISINKNEEAPILEFFSFFLCKKLHSKQAPIVLWNKGKSGDTICCKEKLTYYRAHKLGLAHEAQSKRYFLSIKMGNDVRIEGHWRSMHPARICGCFSEQV